MWNGIRMVRYEVNRSTTKNVHPWASDIETKMIRADAAFRAALEMKRQGFIPDVIIAHPGWGESLFLKEVWPGAKLGIYCEFFYHTKGCDVGFDPEFVSSDEGDACRLKMKNVNNLLHFDVADAAISPTYWQASTFPMPFRDRISVIHDGIDTDAICPNPDVVLTLAGHLRLTKDDEVITFVNRNLEPYRGYHIFMRALPKILAQRPNARVLIVGGDEVSYGAKAPEGQTWKKIFLDEVGPAFAPGDLERVHFLGHVPYNIFIPLLQLSTLHVYHTYPFVLSWSLLEAMSAGCAILASDTQPLREAIVEGKTGCLVDFFDVDALAARAVQMLGDKALRENLGRQARQFALENYDLQKICLPKQLAWVDQLSTL